MDPEEHWVDQLSPEGPCWNVNLVDGLDEESTQEIHSLFDCLNKTGNLAPLAEIDEALDQETRFQEPAGLALARLTNALPTSGFDVFGVAGKLLQLMDQFFDDAEVVQAVTVEIIHGVPFSEVDQAVHEPSSGLIVPLLGVTQQAATVLLDQGASAHSALVEATDSQLMADAFCSVVGTMQSEDDELSAFTDDLLPNLGSAWILASNSSNDIWPEASGNSVRDLIDFVDFTGESSTFGTAEDDIRSILGDSRVQRSAKDALVDAANAGHFTLLTRQLLHLASVDPDGRGLSGPGAEDISALRAGLRMLDAANDELVCTIPLVGYDIELGNLSVEILKELTEMDTDTAVERLDLLGDVLGFGFTQVLADALVSSGACPAFTQQLLNDLRVIERLNDPEVENLVAVVQGLLNAVYVPGGQNRLAETVNIASTLHRSGAMLPMEEALRDLSESDLSSAATTLLLSVIDPSSLNTSACPEGAAPLSFDSLWGYLHDGFSGESEDTGLLEVAAAVRDSPEAWVLLDRAALLAANPDARVQELPRLSIELLTAPSGNEAAAIAKKLVADLELYRAALTLAENQALVASLTEPSGDHGGPLVFLAKLILSDTVTVMLQTINLVLDSLGANSSDID